MPETVGKRIGGFGGRAGFLGREGRTVIARLAGALDSGDQVLIAAISGPTPRIVIIRLRL
jgi:hypothetical protein